LADARALPPLFEAGPVVLEVLAVYRRPQRMKTPWRLYRPGRPDGDNLLKAVQDAGNGLLWKDDSQIVVAKISKMYAGAGEPPHVEVLVRAGSTEVLDIPGAPRDTPIN
jgi:Holliday junction resolvase RusA-like endonuclease